jgi:hypothetical protein
MFFLNFKPILPLGYTISFLPFTPSTVSPVDEVAQVVEQFRVVLGSEVDPRERRVLSLGPHVEQVEAEHVRGNASLPGVRAKHSDSP